jgi:hypothetical protein
MRAKAGVRFRHLPAVLIAACIVAGAAACWGTDDYQTEKLGEMAVCTGRLFDWASTAY